MGFLLVMKAEVVRGMIIMRRYWFRTVTGMVIGYTMLVGLIVAFMQKGDEVSHVTSGFSDATTATNTALGFIIGMFAFGIIGMFSNGLQQMAQNGQLEQLCMSPHGLVTNFLARATMSSVMSILTSSILVWAIAATVGGTLHADSPWLIVLLALTFVNLIGFGFMMSGLVLMFKQIGQVTMVIRTALLLLPIAASDSITEWPLLGRVLAHAFPSTDAAICLKYVLVKGQMVESVNAAGEVVSKFSPVILHPSFFLLVVSCVVWTAVGITLFRVMENWSRDKGTLGAY